MTNKNCLIIHGCPSNVERAMNPETRTYDKHWLPWVKQKLIERGIMTEAPLMPEPWSPNYEKFRAEFEKYYVDENTILIGHSCGCSFLVRWLGDTKRKISQLILVAPWKIAEGDDVARHDFYDFPIDETIKDRVGKIVMFTADDEEEDGKKGLVMFHDALGGEVIELPGRGHYTFDDMKTEEFPELLNKINA